MGSHVGDGVGVMPHGFQIKPRHWGMELHAFGQNVPFRRIKLHCRIQIIATLFSKNSQRGVGICRFSRNFQTSDGEEIKIFCKPEYLSIMDVLGVWAAQQIIADIFGRSQIDCNQLQRQSELIAWAIGAQNDREIRKSNVSIFTQKLV